MAEGKRKGEEEKQEEGAGGRRPGGMLIAAVVLMVPLLCVFIFAALSPSATTNPSPTPASFLEEFDRAAPKNYRWVEATVTMTVFSDIVGLPTKLKDSPRGQRFFLDVSDFSPNSDNTLWYIRTADVSLPSFKPGPWIVYDQATLTALDKEKRGELPLPPPLPTVVPISTVPVVSKGPEVSVWDVAIVMSLVIGIVGLVVFRYVRRGILNSRAEADAAAARGNEIDYDLTLRKTKAFILRLQRLLDVYRYTHGKDSPAD